MDEIDELIKEFLVESHDGLEQLDRDLVLLETHPSDEHLLSSIFRTVHTIKGTSSFLEFEKLETVTHAAENLLAPLRDGKLQLQPHLTTILLESIDVIRRLLEQIETNGREGDCNIESLVQRLRDLGQTRSRFPRKLLPAIPSPLKNESPTASPLVDPLPAKAQENRFKAVEKAPETLAPETLAPETLAVKSEVANSSIRIGVNLLDELMNLVGELVLVRNHLNQIESDINLRPLKIANQRLSSITSSLQESVMKTRMQPIRGVWNKLPRIVRNMAASFEKQVQLTMIGEDTELDKSIIEAIRDPLVHMIRNSIDHGLEEVSERAAAGKPPKGNLTLKAFHENGLVNIHISDDGRGINRDKVRQKAVKQGLVSQETAEKYSDRELLDFVFMPGFSTSDIVTCVSGRGVGMDVVKKNVEQIGGRIELESTVGIGTTVMIRIPLTLAIIPAAIVASGSESFAIPTVDLLELQRIEPHDLENRIENILDNPVLRFRGELLPLVSLKHALGLVEPGTPPIPSQVVNVAVVQTPEYLYGILVDSVTDTHDIVVKPINKWLDQHTRVFAGATTMKDGSLSMILDPTRLAKRFRIQEKSVLLDEESDLETTGVLMETVLFDQGSDHPAAIPLDSVLRIEEIDKQLIKRLEDRWFVNYHGTPLSVLKPDRLDLDEQSDNISLILLANERQPVGLLAKSIINIITTPKNLRCDSNINIIDGELVEVYTPDRFESVALQSETNEVYP